MPPEQHGSRGEATRLIAGLEAQGEVDAHGGFTLDRDQARRKIQHFQFAEPARYVLELVQAAVLKGARNLVFSIRFAELHLRCDGEPFTLVDFEHLYGALLLRARGTGELARRHLALGLCTALGAHPALVRVESGDARGGVFLELRKDAPDRLGSLPARPQRPGFPTTHICVRQRLQPQLVKRFFAHRQGKLAEEELLRRHCAYAPIRIGLDAVPLAQDLSLPDVDEPRPFVHENIRGLLGPLALAPARWSEAAVASFVKPPTELRLVKNGVWVDTVHPELLLPGDQALADCPTLRQDLSHEHVVPDEQYQWVVNVVFAHQISRLAADCARVLAEPSRVADTTVYRLRGQLKTLLHRLGNIAILLKWAGEPAPPGPRGTPAPHLPQQVAGAGHLLRFPLFRSTRGVWVNLHELLADAGAHGSLAFSPQRSSEPDPSRPLVLHLVDKWEQSLLATLLDCPLHDRTAAIQHAVRRAHNHAAWLRRPLSPVLPGDNYLAQAAITGPGLKGEVGVSYPNPTAGARRLMRLLLVYKGHLLIEKAILTPVPDLTMVIEADFTPTDLWSDVAGNTVLSAALTAGFAALWPLLQTLARTAAMAAATTTALEAQRHPARARLLRGLLFLLLSGSAQQQLRMLCGVDKDLALTKPPQAVDVALLREVLLDCPLFEQLGAELASLRQVDACAQRLGCVPVLVLPPPQGQRVGDQRAAYARRIFDLDDAVWQETHAFAPQQAPSPQRPPLVLCVPSEEPEADKLLRGYLGEKYADMHLWLRALKRRPPGPGPTTPSGGVPMPAHLLHPVAPPRRMQNECWAWVPLEGGASYLGLLSLPSPTRELNRVVVELYRGETLIDTRQFPLPTGELLLASVELTRLPPFTEHELAVRLTHSLSATLPVLASAVLHGTTLPPDERLWLLRLTSSLFPTLVFRRVYEKLRQEAAPTPAGQQLAEAQYRELLRLAVRYPVRVIEEALLPELNAAAELAPVILDLPRRLPPPAATPPAAAAAELLEETITAALSWIEVLYPGSAELPAAERVRRPLPLLREAPMLNSVSGTLLSLQTVLGELAEQGAVQYARPGGKEPVPAYLAPKIVGIPDSSSWESLCCLLGEQSLSPFAGAAELAAPAHSVLHADLGAGPSAAAGLADAPPRLAAPTPGPLELLWESVQAELVLLAQVGEPRRRQGRDQDSSQDGSADGSHLGVYLQRVRVQFAPSDHPSAVLCTADQLLINPRHPLISYAAARWPAEPALRLFVAAAVHTAVMARLGAAGASDPAEFYRRLAGRARALLGDA